jgi:hypothetical protein
MIQMVKRLPSFRIKSLRHWLSIVIGPGASVNGEQVDVNVRVDFLLRNAMEFSKSKHGDQMSGQRARGSLA